MCALLPNIGGWVKNFDDAKTISFLVNDKKLLIKFNEIWGKILKNIRRKKFDSDPAFDKKYLKTKIKSYKGRISTNFNVKVP